MYLRLVVGTKGKHNHEDQTPTQLDGLEIMINTFLERKSVCLQPAMFEALAERHEIRRREVKSIRRQHIHYVSTILSLANDLLSCHITNIVWQFGSNNRMFSVSLVERNMRARALRFMRVQGRITKRPIISLRTARSIYVRLLPVGVQAYTSIRKSAMLCRRL